MTKRPTQAKSGLLFAISRLADVRSLPDLPRAVRRPHVPGPRATRSAGPTEDRSLGVPGRVPFRRSRRTLVGSASHRLIRPRLARGGEEQCDVAIRVSCSQPSEVDQSVTWPVAGSTRMLGRQRSPWATTSWALSWARRAGSSASICSKIFVGGVRSSATGETQRRHGLCHAGVGKAHHLHECPVEGTSING